MAKKMVIKKETSSTTEKLLIATVSLLAALFILNIVTLTGYATKFGNSSYSYYGKSNCFTAGGIIFTEGVSATHNGHDVTLLSSGEDVVAVTVDGMTRPVKAGQDVYINGVTVTNFASTEMNACLILK